MALIELLYFFLPAAVANMMPVLVNKVPILNNPLDHKKTWNKKRIFGKNKTYRGIIAGLIGATITAYVQSTPIIIGLAMGIGALGGDLIKSCIKRQANIKPGVSWTPWDQIDWIIGAIILTAIFKTIYFWEMIQIIIIAGLLHPIVNYIGYKLKLKKNKF